LDQGPDEECTRAGQESDGLFARAVFSRGHETCGWTTSPNEKEKNARPMVCG